MARGRPLRFIGGVLAGWTGIRIALLWPALVPLPTLDALPVMAASPAPLPMRSHALPTVVPDAKPVDPPGDAPPASVRGAEAPASRGDTRVTDLPDHAPALSDAADAEHREERQVIASPLVALPAAASRLTIDAWLVARPGGGDSLAFGQLGASQGGARVTYALDRRVALSGRVSAPLRGSGREVGVGIDVRPTRLPVHLLVEERFDLKGGTARPAALAIAGGSAALPGRGRVDIYVQGGAVWRRGGFVDGAAVFARPVAMRGTTRLELGGGAWGAAQRRVARLDVGPSIALVAPGGGGTMRVQFDYRARIAGRARPGSGPALTLGGSF